MNEQVWYHRVNFGPLQFVNFVLELVWDWVQHKGKLKLWNNCFELDNQHEIFGLAVKLVFLLNNLVLAIWFFNLFDDVISSFQNVFDSFESALSSQKIICFEQNWGFWLENRPYSLTYFFLLFVQNFFQLISGKPFCLIFFIDFDCSHLIFNQFLDRPENRFLTFSILDFDSTFVPVSFFITQVFDKFVKLILFLCCFFWFTDNKTLQCFICTFPFFKLNCFKLFLILQQF